MPFFMGDARNEARRPENGDRPEESQKGDRKGRKPKPGFISRRRRRDSCRRALATLSDGELVNETKTYSTFQTLTDVRNFVNTFSCKIPKIIKIPKSLGPRPELQGLDRALSGLNMVDFLPPIGCGDGGRVE
jgi:hypothetical protein